MGRGTRGKRNRLRILNGARERYLLAVAIIEKVWASAWGVNLLKVVDEGIVHRHHRVRGSVQLSHGWREHSTLYRCSDGTCGNHS